MTIIKIDDDIELGIVQMEERFKLFETVDKNRHHLREWLPWVDHSTSPDSYITVIQAWQENIDRGTGLEVAIYYRGELCGMTGYNMMAPGQGRAQIGYWISKDAEGKGIVKRAVKGLIDYGFDRLGLNRVEIICGDKNYRSRAIPEAFGFAQEAVMAEYEFLYDHYHDCILYRMLKKDWVTGNK
ncbi:GNAT family N-acetyltransferase [Salinicoccus carnicancri]|uniref:GNAT family N-acetyltransferase n=1 Tax=Salinicoccus carnicancri TaxID=558170 RepID=UPI0002EF7CFE|nr:GNAT family protein [Salinicoccus carnicancri]